MEHSGHNRIQAALDGAGVFALCSEQCGQLGQRIEGERAALVIFGTAWLEPNDASVEIHLGPCEPQVCA
jgi:hypothetical protein